MWGSAQAAALIHANRPEPGASRSSDMSGAGAACLVGRQAQRDESRYARAADAPRVGVPGLVEDRVPVACEALAAAS
jgi:hypothetical protein